MEADELEASPPFPLFLDRERNKWLLVRNERDRKGKKREFIERDRERERERVAWYLIKYFIQFYYYYYSDC